MALITEHCKLSPQTFGLAVRESIRKIYGYCANGLDVKVLCRFSEWFSVHMNNFRFHLNIPAHPSPLSRLQMQPIPTPSLGRPLYWTSPPRPARTYNLPLSSPSPSPFPADQFQRQTCWNTIRKSMVLSASPRKTKTGSSLTSAPSTCCGIASGVKFWLSYYDCVLKTLPQPFQEPSTSTMPDLTRTTHLQV